MTDENKVKIKWSPAEGEQEAVTWQMSPCCFCYIIRELMETLMNVMASFFDTGTETP